MPPKRRYVDRRQLKELCLAQLTNDEISRILRVSWDTLDRRYAEAIKAWRLQGPGSARRRLYSLGMREDAVFDKDGNEIGSKPASVPSLIFFLKNYGGMSDKHEHSGPNGGPIEVQSLDHLTDEQVRQIGALVETAQSAASKG